jgi:hypothetical protein
LKREVDFGFLDGVWRIYSNLQYFLTEKSMEKGKKKCNLVGKNRKEQPQHNTTQPHLEVQES